MKNKRWSELDDNFIIVESSRIAKELLDKFQDNDTHPRIAATALGVAWMKLLFACEVPLWMMKKSTQVMINSYEKAIREKENEEKSR